MILDNYPKNSVKLHSVDKTSDGKIKCEFEVFGDEKQDHLAFNYWMQNQANDFIDMIIKFDGKEDIENSIDDDGNFGAIYTYYFEPETEEINAIENDSEDLENDDEEMVEFDGNESLKFNIAKEQVKRYNEGKMPENWEPKVYLTNLVTNNHISEEQKHVIEEAFLIEK